MRYKLSLIGNYNQISRQELLQYIEDYNLIGKVDLVGPINSRNRIKEIYRGINVILLPTYYPNEAQPRSLIEAMCFGTALTATDHASIASGILDSGKIALIVEKKSGESIYGKLL